MKMPSTRPISRARTVLAVTGACTVAALAAGGPVALAHQVPSAKPCEPTRHFMPIGLPVVVEAPAPCDVPGLLPMPGYPAGDGGA